VLVLFCLWLANTEACGKGKKEGGEIGSKNRWSMPKEGEKPQNIVPITLRVAPEQGRFHGVKTPEAMRQQRADEAREAAKQLLGKHWGATVFENPIRVPRPLPKNPGEQRGEAAPAKPTPVEQRGNPQREQTGPEYDPQLRELTTELYAGDVDDQGITYLIRRALTVYPELPADKALKRLKREHETEGFSFP
jgi:hypothetical protein